MPGQTAAILGLLIFKVGLTGCGTTVHLVISAHAELMQPVRGQVPVVETLLLPSIITNVIPAGVEVDIVVLAVYGSHDTPPSILY